MLGCAPLSGLCPGRHGSFAIQIFVAVAALVVTSLLIMTDFYELDIEKNLDAVLELERRFDVLVGNCLRSSSAPPASLPFKFINSATNSLTSLPSSTISQTSMPFPLQERPSTDSPKKLPMQVQSSSGLSSTADSAIHAALVQSIRESNLKEILEQALAPTFAARLVEIKVIFDKHPSTLQVSSSKKFTNKCAHAGTTVNEFPRKGRRCTR